MIETDQKIELLAPAGNMEKLEIAIHYGADAVYLAGKDFSLRNFSENFDLDELLKAVEFAHSKSVKVYVACNIYPRNHEINEIKDYLLQLGEIGPDAIIIADPGIFMQTLSLIPHIPVHLSTQANTTNYKSVYFWEKLGVKRVNLARELSLDEIREISLRCSSELEVFVHGAMCISYSGRCLLSSYMTNRDSNRGKCSHPCRWKYAVVEELRPGKYMPLAEDDRSLYIFSSDDICMIEHIPDLIEAGILSLKIEGRMKGINYVASVVKVYREAIDSFYECPDKYQIDERWIKELVSISHRNYCTGFYFGKPDQTSLNVSDRNLIPGNMLLAKITKSKSRYYESKYYTSIGVRNKLFKGDDIEILCSRGPVKTDKISDIIDANGMKIPFAQPGSNVEIAIQNSCMCNDLIRKI